MSGSGPSAILNRSFKARSVPGMDTGCTTAMVQRAGVLSASTSMPSPRTTAAMARRASRRSNSSAVPGVLPAFGAEWSSVMGSSVFS